MIKNEDLQLEPSEAELYESLAALEAIANDAADQVDLQLSPMRVIKQRYGGSMNKNKQQEISNSDFKVLMLALEEDIVGAAMALGCTKPFSIPDLIDKDDLWLVLEEPNAVELLVQAIANRYLLLFPKQAERFQAQLHAPQLPPQANAG